VSDTALESTKPQKPVEGLQYIDLLPDAAVQQNFIWQWAVLESRVVTKYLPAFAEFRKDVIFHIPHKCSEEMSTKSETCSLGMEFFNPNVAADMAQILKDYQSKYVPCFTSENKQTTLSVVGKGTPLSPNSVPTYLQDLTTENFTSGSKTHFKHAVPFTIESNFLQFTILKTTIHMVYSKSDTQPCGLMADS